MAGLRACRTVDDGTAAAARCACFASAKLPEVRLRQRRRCSFATATATPEACVSVRFEARATTGLQAHRRMALYRTPGFIGATELAPGIVRNTAGSGR
jgi:hypothetical protein